MSDHLHKNNILRTRYGAEISPGRRRFVTKTWFHEDRIDPRLAHGNVEISTVDSIQLDLHPADFNRLCDTLDYMFGSNDELTATQQVERKFRTSPADAFTESLYHKRHSEEELRRRHPLLQDLWDQYQMTLNLIKSGKDQGNVT